MRQCIDALKQMRRDAFSCDSVCVSFLQGLLNNLVDLYSGDFHVAGYWIAQHHATLQAKLPFGADELRLALRRIKPVICFEAA